MWYTWLIFSINTTGITALYDLGINKNSGTISLWINKKAGSGVI